MEDVRDFLAEHQAVTKRLARKYVGVVDLLQADVLPVPVVETLISVMAASAPQVERTAFLVRESALFALQLERVIRNSNHPDRRVFRSPDGLQEWLAEVLDPQEQTRLAQFIDIAIGSR
jgi:hypothetical protein